MTDVINNINPPRAQPTLTFDWDQKGPPFTYTAGTHIYSPVNQFYTPVGSQITFVAITQWPNSNSRTDVEYFWDLGDGTFGYGNPVAHTYKVANPQAQAVVRMTDSEGVYWYTRRQLYLRKLALTIATPGATAMHT